MPIWALPAQWPLRIHNVGRWIHRRIHKSTKTAPGAGATSDGALTAPFDPRCARSPRRTAHIGSAEKGGRGAAELGRRPGQLTGMGLREGQLSHGAIDGNWIRRGERVKRKGSVYVNAKGKLICV